MDDFFVTRDEETKDPETFQARRFPLLAVIITAGFLVVMALLLPAFSGLAVAIWRAATGLGVLVIWDAFVLRKSNTHEEIVEKQNTAYGLYFLGLAILIGLTMSTA